MENILLSHNKHWDRPYEGLYPRNVFQQLAAGFQDKHIQILQGVRRSGKSTLFKLLINELLQSENPREILYLNLEDPFFIKYGSLPEKLYEIVETTEKLTQTRVTYLFLDEIQAITGWEKYIKTVYDNGEFKKIFITGSNSSLLNGEYASLLTGRYLSCQVYPFSYSEWLVINGISSYFELVKNKTRALTVVDSMLEYGSFVEVIDARPEIKREILASYYDTILLKDCVANNHVRDIKSFKDLSYYLISNVTSLYSYSSLAKAIGIHDRSVKEFIQYIENAWLLSELRLFSWSLKKQQNNKKKPYCVDNGFISLSFQFSPKSGVLLENLVFTEFKKAGKEIYFYNKNFECDFIIKNPDNSLEAVQVCYEINDKNKKREVEGLQKLDRQFQTVSKTVITYNQEMDLDGVHVVPFWKAFAYLRGV